MITHKLAAQLSAGLEQLEIHLPIDQQRKLLVYLDLLQRWNRSYNLTAIRDPQAMISQILLDALVALEQISAGPVLDVGTGAGIPGLPLAIACPALDFTLLDSNGKKTRFVKQAVMELEIPNVDVVQSRVEAYQPQTRFATIVSRAYSDLSKLVISTSHLLQENSIWLAWKGEHIDAELTTVAGCAQVLAVIPIQLPGVSRTRYLVRLKRLAG